jgi:predicted DCC family thiol-disulfide oxidoreductase YuxK
MDDPILVYDDDCGFCTWSARFVAARSTVELVGFSELTDELLDRLPEDYEDCAHLVTDEEVYSCGAGMEEAFLRTDLGEELREPVGFLRQFEDYDRVRERGYRLVADNRDLFGKVLSADPPRDS